MTESEKKKAEQDVIYLAGCAIKEQVPEQKRVETMNLDYVYKVASRHMLAAAISYALESAGYKSKRTATYINKAVHRAVLFKNAWEEIRQELEKAQIWYMPLKGSVLQYYYPKFGMREMTDYDILIDADRAADVKGIMERQGYATAQFDKSHHDVYEKAPCLNFEMHTELFGPQHDKKLYTYYQRIQAHINETNGLVDGFERSFRPEDLYLYILSHEYKHYTNAGIGLRSLIDTYVFLNKEELDMGYVNDQAAELGLLDFEKQNRHLSNCLFGNGELSYKDREMLDYIFSSGAHGTTLNLVRNRMKKNHQGKIQYILSRFFVPVSKNNKNYIVYAKVYPTFYKYKVLLPLLPFYRVFRAIKSGRFMNEAEAIKKVK